MLKKYWRKIKTISRTTRYNFHWTYENGKWIFLLWIFIVWTAHTHIHVLRMPNLTTTSGSRHVFKWEILTFHTFTNTTNTTTIIHVHVFFLLCDNGKNLIDFHIAEHTFQYITLCVVLQCITYLSWYFFFLCQKAHAQYCMKKIIFPTKVTVHSSGALQGKIHNQMNEADEKTCRYFKANNKRKYIREKN